MTKVFNRSSEKDIRRELRHNMPKAEVLLWSRIRDAQILGCKFRRQYSVGPYVIDFYCPAVKLAIEIDGDSHFHAGAEIYDAERQTYIELFGIHFLRFTNTDVFGNLDGVLLKISETLVEMLSVPCHVLKAPTS